jgi:DNA processing protein
MTAPPPLTANPAQPALKTLTNPERRDWLRLIRAANVGPATFLRLFNRFGSASTALEALPFLTRRGGSAKPLAIPTPSEAEDELAAIDEAGAKLIGRNEPAYPPLLRHIHDPPPLLMVLGDAAVLGRTIIAIVGARNASAAGKTLAGRIARGLGEKGYVVASGLARGMDGAAHRAALTTGTIAVLAGGLDHIYPPEHLDLANQIIAEGGALISEMPLGWNPRAVDFPRRNRLVSGLAEGTLIVEAARRSGSLITARLALEQNREVFAVPGSPLDARAEGVNGLIRDGATLTRNAADIIEQLRERSPRAGFVFKEQEHEEFEFAARAPDDPQTYESDRARLLSALSVSPVAIDDLIVATALAPATVHTILLELELASAIERAAGGLVALIG